MCGKDGKARREAGQGGAGQCRGWQGRAGVGRAGQDGAGQGGAGQCRVGQGRAGQGRAGVACVRAKYFCFFARLQTYHDCMHRHTHVANTRECLLRRQTHHSWCQFGWSRSAVYVGQLLHLPSCRCVCPKTSGCRQNARSR